MIEKKETREVYYALSRKLLDLMLQSGYLNREEYEKNRRAEPGNLFSGTCASICVKP